MKKPVALIIMDGFGESNSTVGNAVKAANTPNLDRIEKTYPTTLIKASGLDVGLPDGQMGNSEVGHTNIGAGRIVYQDLTRITKSIQDGDFFTNEVLNGAMENAKEHALHIMGLLSDGGVHSHIDHLKALIKMAKEKGVERVYVHAFTDGRDTDPQSGLSYAKEIEAYMAENGVGQFATVNGRYYAMDRDKRWERVEKAYKAMVCGEGETSTSASEAIEESYKKGATDEFIVPTVIIKDNQPVGKISDGDSVIFANFRPDRAIQLATVITNPTFYEGYVPEKQVKDLEFVCMMKYADSVNGEIAFVSPELTNTLGDYLSAQGLKQLRIAETEKYAHVTFFFDGGVDKEIEGATRVLVNSPKVATYDLQPEMSAYEVKDKLIAELDKDIHDVVIVNFANCDMVGHTGVIPAAIKAVSVVDECIGEVYEKVLELGGTMLITADHGNAEEELDADGNPFTAHTTNVVPLIVTNSHVGLKEGGKLGDLAPTMLQLLGLPIPEEMDGESLLK